MHGGLIYRQQVFAGFQVLGVREQEIREIQRCYRHHHQFHQTAFTNVRTLHPIDECKDKLSARVAARQR
jgi:hypothetical protein